VGRFATVHTRWVVLRVPLVGLQLQLRGRREPNMYQTVSQNGFHEEAPGNPADWSRSIGRESKIVAPPAPLAALPPTFHPLPSGALGRPAGAVEGQRSAGASGGRRVKRRSAST
jgi:hypothetical protein